MPDVVIIGAGPAGMSAAWWCHELGLRVALLEQEATSGGQLRRVFNPITNYLGLPAADGPTMAAQMAAHFAQSNLPISYQTTISRIDCASRRIFLADGATLTAQAIIIATGVRRRTLGVAGEAEFSGRGMVVSGMRDRAELVGQRVCVVGGGDAAAENALLLAEYADFVTLVHRGPELRARREFVERGVAHPRIRFLPNTVALRFWGADKLAGVELQTQAQPPFMLEVEAALVRIGVAPNSELVDGQGITDAAGYLVVNALQETAAPLVYAAGDVANPTAPTLAGAVGAGATAAKALYARLNAHG